MKEPLFRGCGTALATPFRDGQVDEAALRVLIARQLDAGVDALILCGTTGEPSTLDEKEWQRVLETGLETVAGRVPVLAGAGGNDTRAVLRRVRLAQDVGADGLLMVTPYYNKTTQEGLCAHFARVAESTSLPMILYNVPSRTGLNMLPETAARLCELTNVVGVKEACGDISQAAQLLELCSDTAAIYSGNDDQALPMMALGAQGVISVVSNVAPADMAALAHACLREDYPTARALHRRLMPLMRELFREVNPIPVKAALEEMDLCSGEVRLPLVPMRSRGPLLEALRAAGCLK